MFIDQVLCHRNFMLKRSKYKIDQVDTMPVVRYWPEVICCSVPTHVGDLEVKAMDFEILV